jgi:triphosphoribosyl-dephospho-CoA synthase
MSSFAKACFVRACALDVAVRKPGNVSRVSPGHRMQAEQFIASAAAAVEPLFGPGARVGQRIEGAVNATWAAVGCNTNLGIVLLCAPIAAATERQGPLRGAVEAVLADLDVTDAAAAYRAIARANPGGLGRAPAQDVSAAPSLDLRAAMALAADRDRIACQYANGFADLFDMALPLLPAGFELASATEADVQRVFLGCLAAWPDSHIVRKHGEAVAHSVMTAAQGWRDRGAADAPAEFAAWDESLKAAGINPGTSADLTVATLLLGGLCSRWHGS